LAALRLFGNFDFEFARSVMTFDSSFLPQATAREISKIGCKKYFLRGEISTIHCSTMKKKSVKICKKTLALLNNFASMSPSLQEKTTMTPSTFIHSLATTLIRAAAVVALSLSGALMTFACGISWTLPESPFEASSSGDYRFSLWEKWGDIPLDAKTSIPIHVGFSPIPGKQSSKILGNGWAFPLLESTCLPASDGKFRLTLPDGHVELLEKANATTLKGAGWIAQFQGGRTITAKASCGWTLVYRDGALIQTKSPEGVVCDFLTAVDGTRKINANGKTVLTLRKDFDKTTTLKIYHLTFADKHAVLEMGQRPTLTKIKERKNGKDVERDKETRAESLLAIRFAGEPEIRYNFKVDELLVAEHSYKWNKETMFLNEDDGVLFSFSDIKGIQCFKKLSPDGTFSILGFSKHKVLQKTVNGLLELRESVPISGVNKNRKTTVFESNGKESIVEQHWYDETGETRCFRQGDDENGVIYEKEKDGIKITRVKDRKVQWMKRLDSKNRITELISEGKIYHFYYEEKNGAMRVVRRDATNSSVELPSATSGDIQQLLFSRF
jgi:hypothetical protein